MPCLADLHGTAAPRAGSGVSIGIDEDPSSPAEFGLVHHTKFAHRATQHRQGGQGERTVFFTTPCWSMIWATCPWVIAMPRAASRIDIFFASTTTTLPWMISSST